MLRGTYYLCDLIQITKTGKAIINLAKKENCYNGYANWNSISYALFATGHLVWNSDEYVNHKLNQNNLCAGSKVYSNNTRNGFRNHVKHSLIF